ncbi:DUF4350 domain-containing protein [Erythrobacter crassostreae]|uniref:DUF4350 domain-containing protein n=1 Tax=Erythrobacter crassostreae TaxID=2828328 RepID=A0A9X1F110_9SPHN|nr:DUF4350 domain-containing protein [Erythrobacter crassostrea]MBV7258149.1 DUF4350 domain-containing protein [Erythrobacter crassostrea]
MSAATRSSSPFSKMAVLGIVLVGFLAFISLLYFLSAGDTGDQRNDGAAHASATGLNGYAGFVRLLEKENYDVTLSRTPGGLETTDLLILTPSLYADGEEIGRILNNRDYLGPTIVILPKWFANRPPRNLPGESAGEFKEGWVQLGGATQLAWTSELPGVFEFEHQIETLEETEAPNWSGIETAGELPTKTVAYAEENELHQPLITDGAGHTLALSVLGEEGSEYYEDAHWTIFVVEPDLVNNYGLARSENAEAALALVREAGYGGEYESVTIDMTLQGFGGADNLLTLAFRPPFLAATLCLILAMLIIGWRAFLRFGPAAVSGPEIAFGKKRLVSNGAGLIVRAKRLGLLAEPYADLSARRLSHRLGLTRPEPEAIDAALAARLPDEEPYSLRADRLREAQSPTEILRAAQALRELEGKLAK